VFVFINVSSSLRALEVQEIFIAGIWLFFTLVLNNLLYSANWRNTVFFLLFYDLVLILKDELLSSSVLTHIWWLLQKVNHYVSRHTFSFYLILRRYLESWTSTKWSLIIDVCKSLNSLYFINLLRDPHQPISERKCSAMRYILYWFWSSKLILFKATTLFAWWFDVAIF